MGWGVHCIEGLLVESKVIVVPWVSSCMGFVPEGSSMSSPEGTNPILYSAGDLCHSAFIDPANCFTRSHSFVHARCLSSTNNYGASACCSGGFVCL